MRKEIENIATHEMGKTNFKHDILYFLDNCFPYPSTSLIPLSLSQKCKQRPGVATGGHRRDEGDLGWQPEVG